MAEITIYTDGACSGNPGPGGYACILQTTLSDGNLYEIRKSQGYSYTTNNRMELLGVITGLQSLKNTNNNVEIISDSKYVCDAFNQKWIESWKEKDWTKKADLKNVDLWKTLYSLVQAQKSVKFTWVKGHASNFYNNECDKMAVAATEDKNNWIKDEGMSD